MKARAHRLPTHLRPRAYTIAIAASPRRDGFSGRVAIDLEAAEAGSRTISLHARALSLSAPARLVVAGAAPVELASPAVDAARETWTWRLGRPLPAGRCRLIVAYRGRLGESMHGLYRAEDGPERALVSQCEATDARAIFPCMDEPALKATLAWRVVTDRGLEVVTNGRPTARRDLGRGRVLHAFAPTEVISTYLAALAIGSFAKTPSFRVVGRPCRMLAGRGKLAQTRFAAQVTRFVLPWYERYFGQKYPFDKLDQVAVPGFDAGAMENVGAIFYRQNLLLMDPRTTAWGAQKRIAEVVAHEIAHQWFGNLVTMQWWDDLWLNEAFATWIAYKVSDAHRPAWRMWDDFLGGKHAALAADAQVATHPVYQPVASPAEATELFDVITYEKGCAVLRMVEAHIGAAAFQAGIARYMRAHRLGNATGADLWNSLEQAARQPVARLMHAWVTQPGHPLIEATAAARGGLTLTQRRFFADPAAARRGGGARWPVPLTVIYERGGHVHRHRLVVGRARERVALPGRGPVAWAHLNPDATGFFRTRLDAALWRGLIGDGLRHLPAAAKLTLLDDQWALVGAELAPVGSLMDLLLALSKERDPVVLKAMVGRLFAVEDALLGDRPPSARPLAALARRLFAAPAERLGWRARAGESPHDAALRAAVWAGLGQWTRAPGLLAEARRLAELERRRPAAVEPSLAHAVVRLHAMGGGLPLFRRFVATYAARKRQGVAPDLATRYLYALPAFERPEVVRALLAACLDGTVPQEQLRVLLGAMLSRPASQRATWRFVAARWPHIGPRVGAMGVARLVEATGALPRTMAGELRAFFARHPVPEAARARQKAEEAMRERHRLRRRQAPALLAWLSRLDARGGR